METCSQVGYTNQTHLEHAHNFHMKIVIPCSRNKNEKQRFATRRGSPLTAKTCRKDGDLSTVWSSLTFSSFPTGTMSTPYGCSWRSSRRVSGLLLAASSGSGSFPSWSLLNRSRTSLHVLVPQFKFKFSYLLVGAYSLLFNKLLCASFEGSDNDAVGPLKLYGSTRCRSCHRSHLLKTKDLFSSNLEVQEEAAKNLNKKVGNVKSSILGP